MTLKTLTVHAVLAVSVALASGAALAKGHAQTHHCKMADGTMDMAKTKKQCTAAKGMWAKDEAGAMPMGTTGAAAMPMPMTAKMPMPKK